MILERISSPEDLKSMDGTELTLLCEELRQFLISSVSGTGGHLASNLGVVELTVAIHRVFDTSRDRLVFDVGHQCYVHKALTGRRALFDTLRQFGGMCGFPKPSESIHDAFVAGHASNSVSVALGMARARTLRHETYNVLALIGDGALTGGLSFEGLNNAGASGEPMVVILNDNGMAISPSVGGIAEHLSRLRTKSGYYRFKKFYRATLEKLPGGNAVYKVTHRIKSNIKRTLYPCSMFEDMGFTYMGPVDGHNVEQLVTTLSWAKEATCPVLLHVKTVKGKGYAPAEEKPALCHGVGPFDPAVGVEESEKTDFSRIFGQELTRLAGENPNICAITAAMEDGTGLTQFAQTWPDRFFDVGIAEGHAVSMAGGMAKQGLVPVVAVYSTFLQRAFDMLIHDVALQHLHVVLAVDRAGLVGADGATHHGCQDVGYLTEIPGMTVYAPASFQELRAMLAQAVAIEGPVAIRYPRGTEGTGYPEWTGASGTILREGKDFTLVSYGVMTDELLKSADSLMAQGVRAEVVKLARIAPLDIEPVMKSVKKTKRLLVLEDCFANGSIGQQLVSQLIEQGCRMDTVILKNLKDRLVEHGSVSCLRREAGIDAAAVTAAVLEGLHE